MKKISFVIIGAGNRGTKYASKQREFPEEMEVAALADNRRERMDALNKWLQLPEERLYPSAEALLAEKKLADVAVIATQDAQHRAHAIAAMEKGYDLILEKPIAANEEDVKAIVDCALRLDRKVVVGHVLRYTPFYRSIYRLLREGAVGKIESMSLAEDVGYYHIAHSYVRGNWHRLEDSSPMILAKCCHDLDLILWLSGKHCLKLNSFGSLDYFKKENCPEGAAPRCRDCLLDCVYRAETFYLGRIPGWPANVLQPEPTEENILKTLAETNYGRCVFQMDNDVVDHQSVNLLLEDGITVTFQMTGFNHEQTRRIRVQGTKGDLWGDFLDKKIYWQAFGEKEPHMLDVTTIATNFEGHGGGDSGLVRDAIRYFRGDEFDSSSITTIDRSAESHRMAFAAERSRLLGGETLSL